MWVPKRGGKEKDVPVATRLVPDARTTHYWDGSGVTMRTFQSVLGIPEDAWDVYLVYGPGAAELRAAFNADTGHVRVVMLVAPT